MVELLECGLNLDLARSTRDAVARAVCPPSCTVGRSQPGMLYQNLAVSQPCVCTAYFSLSSTFVSSLFVSLVGLRRLFFDVCLLFPILFRFLVSIIVFISSGRGVSERQ